MGELPLVSVIIPTANRYEDLSETLYYLRKQLYRNLEIIVVDNNSRDDTPRLCREEYPEVRYIRLARNMFNVPSRNIAIANATGKYIFCIDDDSFPGVVSLERAVKRMEENAGIGIVSFGVKNYARFFNADSYMDEVPAEEEAESREVRGWSGCGGLLRKEHFDRYGYWEETGSRSMYEITSCIRAWNEGTSVMFFSDVYVYHKVSQKGDAAKVRVSRRGMLEASAALGQFIVQYYPARSAIRHYMEWVYQNIRAMVERRTLAFLAPLFSVAWRLPVLLKDRKNFPQEVMNKARITYNFKGK